VRHWFAHNGARPGTVVRDRIVALSGIIGTVIAPSRDHALRDPARHIADIKTPNGLVIEFQHSAIKPDEVEKRTNFYLSINAARDQASFFGSASALCSSMMA
jgi:hypothetical protein